MFLAALPNAMKQINHPRVAVSVEGGVDHLDTEYVIFKALVLTGNEAYKQNHILYLQGEHYNELAANPDKIWLSLFTDIARKILRDYNKYL